MAIRRRLVTIVSMWRIPVLLSIGLALAVFQASGSIAGKSPLLPASIAPDPPLSGAQQPGAGMFLVAKRTLDGTYFGRTVVFLIEHDENGTLGLIVNRSSEILLSDALADIDAGSAAAHRLHYGGPVEPSMIMMLVQSQSAAKGMAHVTESVYASVDRGVLDALLAANKDARELRFYIGYSGWSAGQLDGELERGSWHVVAADTHAIFAADSDSLWQRLIERLEPEGIQVRDERRFILETAA